MQILIGFDDTDNLESRGTGFHSRELGDLLSSKDIGVVESITRHQLLVHPAIQYTSHNSAACILIRGVSDYGSLVETCGQFLITHGAEESDTGLCIASREAITLELMDFGHKTKNQVVSSRTAVELAEFANIYLEELRGSGRGVIGALAAVALRASGNDGRCIWLAGLRQLSGINTAENILRNTGIEAIQTQNGGKIGPGARIQLAEWVRPVMRNNKATLLIEEVHDVEEFEWRIVSKEIVKQY
jgi:tRNA(Ile2) C34 agmatinyltransferase TiaS